MMRFHSENMMETQSEDLFIFDDNDHLSIGAQEIIIFFTMVSLIGLQNSGQKCPV